MTFVLLNTLPVESRFEVTLFQSLETASEYYKKNTGSEYDAKSLVKNDFQHRFKTSDGYLILELANQVSPGSAVYFDIAGDDGYIAFVPTGDVMGMFESSVESILGEIDQDTMEQLSEQFKESEVVIYSDQIAFGSFVLTQDFFVADPVTQSSSSPFLSLPSFSSHFNHRLSPPFRVDLI